jgi:hypothetical protein
LAVSQSLSLEQSFSQVPAQIPVSGGSVELVPAVPIPVPPPDPGLLPLLEQALESPSAEPRITNAETP